MLAFTHFLTLRQVSLPIHADEIVIWLPEWLQSLEGTLEKLHIKNLISSRVFTIASQTLRDWQNNPTHYIKQHSTPESLDALYQEMLFFIKNDIVFTQRKLPIVGGYPFSSSFSGVKLEVRLVLQDEEGVVQLIQTNQTQSAVGGETRRAQLAQSIKTRIGEIAWIKESMAHFGFSLTDLPLSKPHAELIWCVEHSEALLDHLMADAHFSNLPILNDEFPYEQLIQTPRLEIITSSSCCEHCRMLFAGLRWTLEKRNIHLPIVLYADSPYNDSPKYHEMQGSVYVIQSSGRYFNTQVQCNVPKCTYPTQEKLPVEKRVHTKLRSKEEVDYLCLLYMGGLTLMDILAYGLPEDTYKEPSINPFTYIAPDTLILFAAAHLPLRLDVSPELSEAIGYLASTLEQIDMKLLIDWRQTFIDQLHWLLISQRDPKFIEHARRSIWATNTGFLINHHVHGETDAHRFYECFSLLWKSIKDLNKKYTIMLKYYTSNNHEGMPLGCMVGPLSETMKIRVFSRHTDHLQKVGLYKTERPTPPKPSKKQKTQEKQGFKL